MTHTTESCGKATTPKCCCGGCAGSKHGWTGALTLTQPGMAPVREANRTASEHEWAKASTSVPKIRLTGRKAAAAVDSAKADVIDWLSTAITDPPSTAPAAVSQLIEAVGNIVSNDVFDALCEALGTNNTNKTRAELAENHLFCSLLAALADSMQEFRDDLDKLTREIATRIVAYSIGHRRIKNPSFITDVTAEVAVKGVDNLIQTLAAAKHFKNLQRAIWILAIMMCPAPEKHEEVVRCCLKPLGMPIISEEVQERLKMAMPAWMA